MKTFAAVVFGFLMGLVAANLLPGETAMAEGVTEPAVAALQPELSSAQSPDLLNLQPPIMELMGGTCSDGQSCTSSSQCGSCEGLGCVCLGIRCSGTCACP